MDRAPYMIIGNSVAAVAAVTGIRGTDRERPVTVIAREPHHTYSRPLISYLLGGAVDEAAMLYRAPDFYEKNGVVALLGVEVVRVHPDERTVETSDGRTLGFERLLIATGGRPIVPGDVPGTDAEGVFTFTCWDDARSIAAYVEQEGVKRAVVVGGGLIGLKSMEALVRLGIETTVVELADRILGATFDRKASELARRRLEGAGVSVRCETTVTHIRASRGKVTGVTLRDGGRVPCELVILAIGVVPDTGLVRDSGIRTGRGIVVDDTMRTSVEGIYAAGDVAEAADLFTGEKRTIPIFPNAYRQGLIAGCNMAGGRRTYAGGLAMNSVEVLGLPTISVGVTDPDGEGCEVLSDLDEEGPVYKKVVLKGGRVVGAIFVGDVDRAGIITGLIRERVDVSEFRDVLLTDDFGLISLPREYRKHVVSGKGIVV